MVPPECVYWNFQLNNWWMESMDNEHHRVHVNKRTAVVRRQQQRDGTSQLDSVCIIVIASEQNCARSALPEDVNVLQTAHHSHGTMAWRWVLAKDKHHPTPRCTVMPFDQVRGFIGRSL